MHLMKKTVLSLALLMPLFLWSQSEVSRAYLGNDGEFLSRTYKVDGDVFNNRQPSTILHMAGFPKKVPVHPNFKNMRNVTLADINGDGKDEILSPSMNTLRVFTYTGELLWSKVLTGTPIYPPSVAVMDGTGALGIVQVTGGVPNNGRVYYLDVNGNDMTGWPMSFSNHWIICGPAIADVDNDGTKEIIVQTRTSNNLHVLKTDGSVLWSALLDGTPAVTPSVADIDADGIKDIVTANSSGVIFAFSGIDGSPKPGFPVPSNGYSFSYQSPLLVDLDGNGQLSIVGAAHGDAPEYFVRNSDGTYRTGWPVAIPDASWTYAPPTVVDLSGNNEFSIFTSSPIGEEVAPMLYGFNPDATAIDNFPIVKSGGLESTICVADITGDGLHDLIFGSNLMVETLGFIHAYKTDGTGEIEGFPLRPIGFTFMNGPTLGDVNGDGMLDLVSFSYEMTFTPADSAYVNVYELQVPVDQADVLFGTYKGSNDRTGFIPRTAAFPAPRNLTYAIDIPNVVLDWQAPDLTGNADLILTSYLVYRDQLQIGEVSGDTLSFTDFSVPEGQYIYGITAVYGPPVPGESETVEVLVDLVTSISGQDLPGVRIYPNPAQNSLTIESLPMSRISVVNTVGLVVFDAELNHNTKYRLNTSGWKTGIYMVRIDTNEGVVNKRITIVR